jgi:hypothetical protein
MCDPAGNGLLGGILTSPLAVPLAGLCVMGWCGVQRREGWEGRRQQGGLETDFVRGPAHRWKFSTLRHSSQASPPLQQVVQCTQPVLPTRWI